MDVFDLRQRLVDDYADFTRSFVNIRDPLIDAHVEQELKDGLLWPDPIVHRSPAQEQEPGLHVERRARVSNSAALLARRQSVRSSSAPLLRTTPRALTRLTSACRTEQFRGVVSRLGYCRERRIRRVG